MKLNRRALFTLPGSSHRRSASARPRLEVLEDRLAPATYTVISDGDTGTGAGLSGDLRYCIQQVNFDYGGDIVFDSSFSGTARQITLTSNLPTIAQGVNLTITGPGRDFLT